MLKVETQRYLFVLGLCSGLCLSATLCFSLVILFDLFVFIFLNTQKCFYRRQLYRYIAFYSLKENSEVA
jgi:hypothetical protein